MRRILCIFGIWYTCFACAKDPLVYMYSHGLGGSGSNIRYYAKILHPTWDMHNPFAGWVLREPMYTFNFPDAESGTFNASFTSLGQQNEIDTLTKAYNAARVKGERVVLMGMSRGAATIISFLGQQHPAHLAAVIVESPFDSITNILQGKLAKENISWIPDIIVRTAPSLVCRQYSHKGVTPMDLVDNISPDIPILFIASLEDQIVLARNTINLYARLISRGYSHVYLLLLDKGDHANMLYQADGDLYLYTVHAFYRAYGLAHHAEWAEKGAWIFKQCRPTVDMAINAVKGNRSFVKRK